MKMKSRALLVAACSLFLTPSATLARTIEGTARVIDGDTLVVQGQTIRLAAIDAPETAQRCMGGPARFEPCGRYVTARLEQRLHSVVVSCRLRSRDAYDRWIAHCRDARGDLSSWLVSRGLARAFVRYSVSLLPQETIARIRRRGLWQTEFQAPWEFRANGSAQHSATALRTCRIKGNIARNGERIYHTPSGSRWYSRTRIDETAGERWFCTEREAIAAGWRPPRG